MTDMAHQILCCNVTAKVAWIHHEEVAEIVFFYGFYLKLEAKT